MRVVPNKEYHGSRRDYLINRIMKSVGELNQSSGDSELGWFEDGIGLSWYWSVTNLMRLTDESLELLVNSRSNGAINFSKLELYYKD